MSTVDEEAPFSEQILRWLDEGDKLGEVPEGTRTVSTAGGQPSLRSPTRGLINRDRTLFLGAGLVGIVAVVILRLVLSSHGAQTAASTAPASRAVLATAAPTVDEGAGAPSVTMGLPTITMKHKAAAAPVASGAPASPATAPAPAAAMPAPAQASVAKAAPPVAQVAAAPAPSAATPAVAAPAAPATAANTYDADLSSCRASLTAGRIRAAVAACQHAIDARPTEPAPLTLLAEAEFSRGRGREALRLATAAVASNPGFADAYVIIGSVHQDLGHRDEAFAAYRRYLALAPRGAHAGELRALLASR